MKTISRSAAFMPLRRRLEQTRGSGMNAALRCTFLSWAGVRGMEPCQQKLPGVLQAPHPSVYSRRPLRERGSVMLIVMILLFAMTVLTLSNGRTLYLLKRELRLIDQKQQQKFQTSGPAEIKPKPRHAQ